MYISKISWRLSAAAGIDPPLHWALRFSHEDFGAQKLGDPPFFDTIFWRDGMMTWIWVGKKKLIFFVVFWEKLMENYESEIWVRYDLMGDGIACKMAGLQNLIICWKWWIQESSALWQNWRTICQRKLHEQTTLTEKAWIRNAFVKRFLGSWKMWKSSEISCGNYPTTFATGTLRISTIIRLSVLDSWARLGGDCCHQLASKCIANHHGYHD